jgi:hypothetical protein
MGHLKLVYQTTVRSSEDLFMLNFDAVVLFAHLIRGRSISPFMYGSPRPSASCCCGDRKKHAYATRNGA